MRAYHFFGERLRDCSTVPEDGVTLVHEGPLELCRSGFHGSLHPYDALNYAPGRNLALVEMGGKILEDKDKLVASERTIIKRIDATELLRQFTRHQALSVVDLWDCPGIVRQYLETGDESLRVAARDVAWDIVQATTRAEWSAIRAAQRATWSEWSVIRAALNTSRTAQAARDALNTSRAALNTSRTAQAIRAALNTSRDEFKILIDQRFSIQ